MSVDVPAPAEIIHRNHLILQPGFFGSERHQVAFQRIAETGQQLSFTPHRTDEAAHHPVIPTPVTALLDLVGVIDALDLHAAVIVDLDKGTVQAKLPQQGRL